MLLSLLLLLTTPASAQPTIESAAAQLRPSAAAFAARERKPFKPVKEIEEDWLPEQDELCNESKALDAWSPILTMSSGGKDTILKLAFKGCHTVDRTLGEAVTPVALRLYGSPDGRWGLMLGTEKGASRSSVTLVQHDDRGAWRTSAQLGERPTTELFGKVKDYGTVKLDKFPSGVAIQGTARLTIYHPGAVAP